MAYLILLFTVSLCWLTYRSIYRLFFHPLSHIPGPRLAAVSYIYQFYFDVIKGGMYIWEVRRLHEEYGPIIRINPNEVHINDPDYYQQVYAPSSQRREKDIDFVNAFGLPDSTFGTVSAEVHRRRRAPLNKFFSKKAITEIEPLIYEKLGRLLFHLEESIHSKQPMNIDAGFVALTADIIHHYTYGYSEGHLERENFNHTARDGINGLFRLCHLQFFFPPLKWLESLPLSIVKKINVHAWALANQKQDLYNEALKAENSLHQKKSNESKNIIDVLVNPHDYSLEEDRRLERIKNEGMSLITAGTETTGRALAVATFHIYSNPQILDRMREELRQVMPHTDSQATWSQLEQLPYLTAVVNESMRLASGTSGRFSRVAPSEVLTYQKYPIPCGTTISMSNHLMLRHPTVFPDPDAFDPDRWLKATENGERLDKYLVNFSKGSRSCLGLNLAIAEMFLGLASLIRRLDLTLYETSQESIECGRDFGVPYPEQGCLNVRVIVNGIAQD